MVLLCRVQQSHLGLNSVIKSLRVCGEVLAALTQGAGFESQHCVKSPVGGRHRRIPGAHWPPAQLQAQEKTLPLSNKRGMTKQAFSILFWALRDTHLYTPYVYIYTLKKSCLSYPI